MKKNEKNIFFVFELQNESQMNEGIIIFPKIVEPKINLYKWINYNKI